MMLAACEHSAPAAVNPAALGDIRVTLPDAPPGVKECLREEFPEIPNRALTRAEMVSLLGKAIVLDKAKTACGERAVQWIEGVRRKFAR